MAQTLLLCSNNVPFTLEGSHVSVRCMFVFVRPKPSPQMDLCGPLGLKPCLPSDPHLNSTSLHPSLFTGCCQLIFLPSLVFLITCSPPLLSVIVPPWLYSLIVAIYANYMSVLSSLMFSLSSYWFCSAWSCFSALPSDSRTFCWLLQFLILSLALSLSLFFWPLSLTACNPPSLLSLGRQQQIAGWTGHVGVWHCTQSWGLWTMCALPIPASKYIHMIEKASTN